MKCTCQVSLLKDTEVLLSSAFEKLQSRTIEQYSILTRYSIFCLRTLFKLETEAYVRAAEAPDAPAAAPYPVQRGLTTPMRTEATKILSSTQRS